MLVHSEYTNIFFLHLTSRPYPKFCQMSTIYCVTNSPVADILKSEWKNNSSGVAPSLKKSSGSPFFKRIVESD